MASLDGVTGITAEAGKSATGSVTSAVLAARTATATTTARPVLPAGEATPAPQQAGESAAEAARRQLTAAVRKAAMRPARPLAPPPEGEGDRQESPAPVLGSMGALIARVTARASLPILPEPASPARAAFAEAVIAMRAGVRLNGTADGIGGS